MYKRLWTRKSENYLFTVPVYIAVVFNVGFLIKQLLRNFYLEVGRVSLGEAGQGESPVSVYGLRPC